MLHLIPVQSFIYESYKSVAVGHIEEFCPDVEHIMTYLEKMELNLLPIALLMQRKQQSYLPVLVERHTGL